MPNLWREKIVLKNLKFSSGMFKIVCMKNVRNTDAFFFIGSNLLKIIKFYRSHFI